MPLPSLLQPAQALALQEYSQLLLGFSGGLDSMVLLHALAEYPHLKAKIQLVHVHHGLSPNADVWAALCRDVAKCFGLVIHIEHVRLAPGSNLEARARKARYDCFARYLPVNGALLTAHHQQDQAETVLANLCRGAGVSGLAAMAKTQRFAQGWQHRPLLDTPKAVLQEYALLHGLSYIEDESNANTTFTRNFLRQKILPALAERFPGVYTTLSRTAEICTESESILQEDAKTVLYACLLSKEKMAIRPFLTYSPARRRNALHSWLLTFVPQAASRDFILRIEEELIFAKPDADPVLQYHGFYLRRYRDNLYILSESAQPAPQTLVWHDLKKPLTFGAHVLALRTAQVIALPDGAITLRSRVGGERLLCHGQHQSVKKLLQAAAIPPWQRPSWPLLYIHGRLAAIPGLVLGDVWRQHFPDGIELVVNGK